MALRITGSVIGEPITSSSSSATGMWLSQEVAALQQDGIWQIAPGFTLTSSAATVNEGASITITLTTTGILNGTAVPYVISGANIFANDSANGVITGNFVIQNNSNTISFAANADLLTEGSEAFTITAGGASTSVTINDTSNAIVNADAQFPYTTLALHGNGTNNAQNNTFLDSSTNNFSITRNGNSTQGTFSPYGGNWSNYFDGTGDYLSVPIGSLPSSSPTWTVECWLNINVMTSIAPIVSIGDLLMIRIMSTGTTFNVDYRHNPASPAWANPGWSYTFTAGTWYHVAIVLNSGSIKVYINGVDIGTPYVNNNTNTGIVAGANGGSGANALWIGAYDEYPFNSVNAILNGHLSNFRITNTAVYTANFTPPTAPLTAIAGTSLLTCQDNRFIDESPNNFTITKNGDVSVQRFSPFSPVITTPTTYSNYFDGTGDYLTTPTSSNLGMGSGDFTIECWVYATSPTYAQGFFHVNATSIGGTAAGYAIGVTAAGAVEYYSGATYTTTSSTITAKTWTHLALVRSSGTVKVYVNGILPTSGGSIADSQNVTTALAYIGVFYTVAASNTMTGSISNFRVVKGTALYTSNFTPPTTPLTAITNTVLLTCQSPTFIDNSTNAFAITVNGNSQPTTANPFGVTNTSSEYSTTTFSGSAYFDGTGDYLTAPSNAAFAFGTGNFTIELWAYPTAAPTTSWNPILTLGFSGGGQEIRIAQNINGTGYGYLIPNNAPSNADVYQGFGTLTLNVWHHLALVKNGSTVTLYRNGVSVGSTTNVSIDFTNITLFRIGGPQAAYINADGYFGGYISNLRVVKGQALYTSNFAPPVAPVTAVANTQLLCNFTNAGIIDNAMMTNLETIADAKISTTQSKFGESSVSFDGTGDYLSTYNPSYSLSVGSGDFTYECWLYVNALPGLVTSVYHLKNDTGLATTVFVLELTTNGAISISTGTAIIAYGTAGKITTGSWIHFAFVRTAGVFKTFFNGIQDISVANTTAYNGTYLYIGAWRYSSYDNSLNGYLDDVRITKGYARYTSNFTPPTEFANK